jgi:hypothetical protein
MPETPALVGSGAALRGQRGDDRQDQIIEGVAGIVPRLRGRRDFVHPLADLGANRVVERITSPTGAALASTGVAPRRVSTVTPPQSDSTLS